MISRLGRGMLSKDKFFSLCKGIVGNFCGSLHEEVFKLWVCENRVCLELLLVKLNK